MTYEQIEITTLQATAGLFRMSAGVPARIAPERENELIGEVLKYQKWALDLAEGNAQFYAIVPDKKVCLTSSGLAVLWNIAFVAFSIADASTRARQRAQENQKSGISNSAIFDLTNFWKDEGLGDRIAYAKKLYHVDSPWPSSIPLPPIDSNATDFDKKVTELFLGALSWLMLHEIGHIHLDHERDITLY
jgi:hypothetical protein